MRAQEDQDLRRGRKTFYRFPSPEPGTRIPSIVSESIFKACPRAVTVPALNSPGLDPLSQGSKRKTSTLPGPSLQVARKKKNYPL